MDDEGKSEPVLHLSRNELLRYLVDRAADMVDDRAKERERRRAETARWLLGVIGLVGLGTLVGVTNNMIQSGVESEFETVRADLDTLSSRAEATAAIISLNSPFRAQPGESGYERSAEDLVEAIAAAPGLANSPTGSVALVQLAMELGPSEAWAVVDVLDEQLGETMRTNPQACSAMATNYAVRVLGLAGRGDARVRPVQERLGRYLECLASFERSGERLWLELLASHAARAPAADSLARVIAEMDGETYYQLDAFRSRSTALLAAPGCGQSAADYVGPSFGASWCGESAKRAAVYVQEAEELYSTSLGDPVERAVRRFTQVAGSLQPSDSITTDLGPVAPFLDGLLTDRWVVDVSAGETVLIEATSNVFDMFIYVRGPDGRVASHDDFDGLNPSCVLTAPESGEYSILVHDRFDQGGGEYTLRLGRNAEVEGRVPSCLAAGAGFQR